MCIYYYKDTQKYTNKYYFTQIEISIKLIKIHEEIQYNVENNSKLYLRYYAEYYKLN